MDQRRGRKSTKRKFTTRRKQKSIFVGNLKGPRGGQDYDFVIDDDRQDAIMKIRERNKKKKIKSVRRGMSAGFLTQKQLDKTPRTRRNAEFLL